MFLRKYWIPLSVFIVAIMGVSLYVLQTRPPKEPIKIYKVVEPEKPTEQPTTQAPVGDTSQGGHIHADGTWHEGLHETATEKNITSLKTEDYNISEAKLMHELTPNERARIWERAYRKYVGGDPPPGYLQAAEQEFQNLLKSVHEPRVHIDIIRGFAPNKEQLRRYLELQEQFRAAHARGADTDAGFFQSEMERLEVEAEGDVPLVSVSWQGEKAKSIANQVLKERTEQAYRDFGLEHLLEHGISGLNTIKPTIAQ